MLTDEQITFIRQLISEPTADNGWPNERIQTLAPAALGADGTYGMNALAAIIWEAKAADAVELVNVSESGSSRSMGQVFEHATQMAARYRAPSSDGTGGAGRTQTRKIVRE